MIVGIEPDAAFVQVGAASRMRVPWGEVVTVGGRRLRLTGPARAEPDPDLVSRLREWRTERSIVDDVPPYVVAHDSHLASIASRHPTTMEELADCDGIGPTRLERYGAEILEVLSRAI